MQSLMEADGLLIVAGAVLAAASIVRGGHWQRAGLLVAGLLTLADGLLRQQGLVQLLLAGVLVIANGLALLRIGGKGMLDADSESFYRRHLSRLTPSQASLLIAQGTFIEARAGEILTREGQPVESLHFLVDGVAAVLIDEAIVGRLGPGDLIGEAVLLGDARASATVRLAADRNRLWFVPKERLAAFLTAQPAIAAELNAATVSALRDKLERANRERAVG